MPTFIHDGFTKTGYTETGNGVRFIVKQDSDAESPRENDNVGRMICWHRRYQLGDEHNYSSPLEATRDLVMKHVPHDADEDAEEKIENFSIADCLTALTDHIEILPIYMYEHSGITISTDGGSYPYNDRWDAGQVGWIYCSRKRAESEAPPGEDWRKYARGVMVSEVCEYDMYLRGETYGFILEEEEDGLWEETDSCWGFIGDTLEESGIMEYLPKCLSASMLQFGPTNSAKNSSEGKG